MVHSGQAYLQSGAIVRAPVRANRILTRGWWCGLDSISKLMLRKYANAGEGGLYGAFRWMFVR
jgi:hypothetical protein